MFAANPLRHRSRLARAFGLTSIVLASAVAHAQDPFEPNDDCASAAALPSGFTSGLTLGPDADYFLVSVPANADLVIDARDAQGASLDVALFEVGCGTQLAAASGDVLRYFDCGGAARDLVLQVPDGGLSGAAYTLDVDTFAVVDDVLEENDTCNTGALVALDSFTTPGLVVTGCDEDFYVARLQTAGIELQVDLLFAHAQGDIDLELWNLGCTQLLGSSASLDDNESLLYVNTTNPPAPQAVVIKVKLKNGVGWADYALTACFAAAPLSTLGVQVCAGVTNSTGRPATLCGRGSAVAALNQAFLYVVDLPMGSAGYFITSPTFQFTPTPGNTMGNLCLGAPGRYSFNVLTTGNTQAVFYQADLTQTPVAGGSFTSIVAGTRQFWQYWYRDSIGGVATSNFSSALCVDFL